MTVIYSEDKRKGLDGVYARPSDFNGQTENCTLVYTNDATIKEAYEAKGIEVKGFTGKPTAKKEDIINNDLPIV